MIKVHCKNRIIGHLSRDSTAVEAREKAIVIKPKEDTVPRKRGRPKKGEEKPKKKELLNYSWNQS